MRVTKLNEQKISLEQTLYDARNGADVYIITPTNKPLENAIGEESDFFLNHLNFRLTYSISQFLLPLLKTRYHLLQEKKNYQSNLSLFAYNFIKSISREVNLISEELSKKELMDCASNIHDFVSLTNEVLSKFRCSKPQKPANTSYYEKTDNYLSWRVEQAYLKLAHVLLDIKDATDIKTKLIRHSKLEREYRNENNLNSSGTANNTTRLFNKMRLFRRTLEQPIVVHEDLITLGGKRSQYTLKAGITAVVMFGLLTILNELQTNFEHLGSMLLLVICVLYGAREVLREELLMRLWRWYYRNRPKWMYSLRDNYTKRNVGFRKIYLDYLPVRLQKNLPKQVMRLLRPNQQEQVIHLRVRSYFNKGNFNPAFQQSEEQIVIDLEPILKLIPSRNATVYEATSDTIKQESIERRVTIHLVIAYRPTKRGDVKYQQIKINANSKQIISVTEK
ncbi:hypothetical protein ACP3V3_02865 [Vibrio sp. PNB22_3_1]